jgi:hypothetical protein
MGYERFYGRKQILPLCGPAIRQAGRPGRGDAMPAEIYLTGFERQVDKA